VGMQRKETVNKFEMTVSEQEGSDKNKSLSVDMTVAQGRLEKG